MRKLKYIYIIYILLESAGLITSVGQLRENHLRCVQDNDSTISLNNKPGGELDWIWFDDKQDFGLFL